MLLCTRRLHRRFQLNLKGLLVLQGTHFQGNRIFNYSNCIAYLEYKAKYEAIELDALMCCINYGKHNTCSESPHSLLS